MRQKRVENKRKFDGKKLFTIGLAILLAGCATFSSGPGRYALMTSPLIDRGWEALSSADYEAAHQYADECIQLYSQEAKAYNEACAVDYPPESVNCGLLNSASQCSFIQFMAYLKTDDLVRANEICEEINQFYFNSVIFDPKGWTWEPAKACRDAISQAEESKKL